MDSVKVDLKLFLQEASRVDSEEFIPVFHNWIQDQRLDELLIDVVDYRHVHDGPGVILIAHDAHYAIDTSEGRLGLLYSRRRETHPTRSAIQGGTERLHSVVQCALQAGLALETEPSLRGRLKFRGDEFLLRINDRLVSPSLEAVDDLKAQIQPVLSSLYPHGPVEVEGNGRADSRLAITIRASEDPDVATLCGRLGESGVAAAAGR